MTNYEEALELLTPGSNWFNTRNNKLVTALCLTNVGGNFSPAFLEANPSQVVFITETGLTMSTTIEKFLKFHTFYNINGAAEELLVKLLELPNENQQDPEPESTQAAKVTAEDVAGVKQYQAKLSTPIDIQFLTTDDDKRRPALLSSDELKAELLSVETEPIIVDRNGGLSNVGIRYALVFNNPADFDKVVDSAFSPSSPTATYAGFYLGGELVQIDAYLGTSVRRSRAGSNLIVHLAQLEEEEAETEDTAEEVILEGEPAPAADAPKDFSALAATLAQQAAASAPSTPAEPATAEVAPVAASQGAAVTIS